MKTQPTDQKQPDHLIPHANRLLTFAVRSAWRGFKGLFKLALRLPRLFIQINKDNDQLPSEKR